MAPRWERLAQEGIVSAGVGTYGTELISVSEFRLPDGSWVGSKLRIGKYCSLAEFGVFLGGNHHTERVSQYPFASMYDLPERVEDASTDGDVVIGNDVWIGSGALVLSGVTIGDGAVIAARAVVTKDVRPYAVVAGNPGREVKRRFDDATVERLRVLKWWDWSEDEVRSRYRELVAEPSEVAALEPSA